jgi:hypothetical protein
MSISKQLELVARYLIKHEKRISCILLLILTSSLRNHYVAFCSAVHSGYSFREGIICTCCWAAAIKRRTYSTVPGQGKNPSDWSNEDVRHTPHNLLSKGLIGSIRGDASLGEEINLLMLGRVVQVQLATRVASSSYSTIANNYYSC